MGMLDHWNVVGPVGLVRVKPVEVIVAGQAICLFRTAAGVLAAVDNACPHRRLKLSVGRVVGDKIECKYHGWTFDACGEGESPGTPKLTTCTTSYDVREDHGLIWLKSRASQPVFPIINPDDDYPIGHYHYVVPAPLEVTLDNFTEIEHTGTVHQHFGYDIERMHEVKVKFEPTESTVRVVNVGPTKRMNWLFAKLLGVTNNYNFHDDWTTHFSPMYSVYDHWWTSPDGSRESKIRWRFYIFFTPITDTKTAVHSIIYGRSKYPGPAGGLRVGKFILGRQIDREMQADVAMLGQLADYNQSIEGMKLSRFDKVLGLNRERIARIYRGESSGRIALHESA
jgi:phenylpropionate dioxygenase-like ring-hydroxylating dioxygenase large terminal subunit